MIIIKYYSRKWNECAEYKVEIVLFCMYCIYQIVYLIFFSHSLFVGSTSETGKTLSPKVSRKKKKQIKYSQSSIQYDLIHSKSSTTLLNIPIRCIHNYKWWKWRKFDQFIDYLMSSQWRKSFFDEFITNNKFYWIYNLNSYWNDLSFFLN